MAQVKVKIRISVPYMGTVMRSVIRHVWCEYVNINGFKIGIRKEKENWFAHEISTGYLIAKLTEPNKDISDIIEHTTTILNNKRTATLLEIFVHKLGPLYGISTFIHNNQPIYFNTIAAPQVQRLLSKRLGKGWEKRYDLEFGKETEVV